MSALTVIVGSWLALSVVLVIALMLRRSRPKMQERLSRWVVGDMRSRAAIAAGAQPALADIGRHSQRNGGRPGVARMGAIRSPR
jgi:hypothetical protein